MKYQYRTIAAIASQAYNAMESTKRRYLDYLIALESSEKKFNLPANDSEQTMLKQLLNDHDEQVTAFKAASDALREKDAAAFDALWEYIKEINRVMAVVSEGKGY